MSFSDTAVLDAAAIEEIVDRFHRDGFALVPGVLSGDECAELRQRTDALFDDPAAPRNPGYSSFALADVACVDPLFCRLMVREPILPLVQSILGADLRYCGSGVLRNGRDAGVTFWHVDDANKVDFPLPDSIARHDPRVHMPIFWMTVQIALTDIDAVEYGPTELVRGSHYAGRLPPPENPVFEGRAAEPVLCKTGDIYLFNHQVWHRGMPNRSDRIRYLLQVQYAPTWRMARFQGAARNAALDATLEGAEPRLRQLFGYA